MTRSTTIATDISLTLLSGLALFAGALICFASAGYAAVSAVISSLNLTGAVMLVSAAGFLGETTRILTRDTVRQLVLDSGQEVRHGLQQRMLFWLSKRLQGKTDGVFLDGGFIAWLPVLLAAFTSAIALMIAIAMWPVAGHTVTDTSALPLLGGVLIVASFPLVVLNRIYAAREHDGQRYAWHLQNLLRVPLLVCIAMGTSVLLRSLGYRWPGWIERAVMVVVSLVAIEIILRSFAQLFMPAPKAGVGRSVTSHVAGMIQPRWPQLDALALSVKRQFGIDLSRSWAASFLQQALIPVAAGLIVVGWLLTGLTTLAIDQRGIYERFGVPLEVQGPGLHFHLPWPLGIVRRAELGVVHEIPIVFQASNDPAASNDIAASSMAEDGTVGAEAMPPPSVDRLWDDLHPSEASYLIASAADGQQGFEIVNIDLRVAYRIGSSDDAVMAATYRLADPQALIRASAGRLLVQHFSRYTLTDVLGENRAAFIDTFRTGLQQRLNNLHTGVEIVAVVVEAIHPPPRAARAYHNVQAAQIKALVQISQSRAGAFIKQGQAQQQAIVDDDAATAWAAEEVSRAHVASTFFAGDDEASHRAGQVFLMERWSDQLQRNLGRVPLLLVDHRLRGSHAPTIDLRRFAPSAMTPPIIPATK